MRKTEIISEISGKIGIEATKVETIVETFMALVKEHIVKKETVSLRGFGNFIAKKRGAKLARNISKNTTINIPAHYIPFFKASREFKQKVRKALN
jgi:DNA-binding protein HU-beta